MEALELVTTGKAPSTSFEENIKGKLLPACSGMRWS
jgi:hypothetical protein